MDRNQRRILKLRNHVLSHKKEKEANFIEVENIGLSKNTIDELKEIAKEKGLEGYSKLKKEELVELIEGA